MKLKKLVMITLTASLAAGLLVGCGNSSTTEESDDSTESAVADSSDYPAGDISGIVQWGIGGGTDSLMRPLAELAEEELGVSINIENQEGNAGATGTWYVYDQEADGYTLLMGAENPQLYEALDIMDVTYDDFEPVFIIGDETVGIAVSSDSAYTTFTELINAALEEPETIRLSTTGKGGLPWEVASYIEAVTGATFDQVTYDSDATAKAAVLNGECDFTVCKVQSGIEDYKAGDLVFLSMLATETVEQLEDVPLIVDEYPGFEEYLPWGPFYGIFVKEGTNQEIIDALSAAFATAYEEESYHELLSSYGINGLALTGDEAEEYLNTWQDNTIKALVKSGAIEKSLEELGIEE